MKHMRESGFTLVEMAIVLTIIALVAGGVFSGTALLHSLELKKIGSEQAEYVTALQSFKDRYNYLPGDFPTATQVWGAANSDATTCQTTDSTGQTATCNGDGDGQIAPTSTTAFFESGSEDYEMFRAWQHLSNAGLLSANVSGISASGTRGVSVGTNVPASKGATGAGWSLLYGQPTVLAGTCFGTQFIFCPLGGASSVVGIVIAARGVATPASATAYTTGTIAPLKHVLVYGGNISTAGHLNSRPVMTPADAQSIDSKLDDGWIDSGKILGMDGPTAGVDQGLCSSSTHTTAHYNYNTIAASSVTKAGCGLMWMDVIQ